MEMRARARSTQRSRWLSVLMLIYAPIALATPAMITVAPRFIPSNGDTDSPYFIGYYMVGANSYSSYDCNPGYTFSVSESWAGCGPMTQSTFDIATSCRDTSIMDVRPGVTYTCSGVESACFTVLLYDNLDAATATTLIPCDTAEFTVTFYRDTERGSYASPTTSTPAQTEETSSITTQSGASTRSNATPGAISSAPLSSLSSSLASSTSPSTTSTVSQSLSGDSNQSNAIALGVGIGLGVPTIIVGTLAWWFPRRRKHLQQG
ncbi:hypothetical protein K491DRAFT_688859 [Lophiostoma macrostomum CBS 122681]|uniref:Mid2 domain-containing protein n=1 Tax=Lophiostoma macrostomum CBS 122681 TaxID=1314788 RepID=A0A6A6TIB6_9PLEO|nr:hypothetical protein K491DRAFT_688859 [Lophiostoma macrostomum CBS 122681]